MTTPRHGYEPGDFRDLEVRIHRAASIGDCNVPTLAIYAHDKMPDTASMEEHRANVVKDGNALADALLNVLPNGVVDHLLRRLLEHRASLLIVPETMTELHLRGAAADLLIGLKALADDYEQCCGDGVEFDPPLVLKAARAYIAKAEGRS
jgi:hypothetical protein